MSGLAPGRFTDKIEVLQTFMVSFKYLLPSVYPYGSRVGSRLLRVPYGTPEALSAQRKALHTVLRILIITLVAVQYLS